MPLIYYEACMLDFSEIEQNARHRNAEKQQSAEARRRVSRARHGQREVVVHHAVTQVGGAVVETRVLTQVLLTFDTHIVEQTYRFFVTSDICLVLTHPPNNVFTSLSICKYSELFDYIINWNPLVD